MELENDGFLYLPPRDANDMYYTTTTTTFSMMPSQESKFGALYLDHGPWITQKLDITRPPPNDAESSNPLATQFSKLESALSSQSQALSTRVQVPLPSSIRQRTAQACDKCRERKTKCSGHRPVCLRCAARGLACEYSTRLRLPTRTRFHPGYIRPITDRSVPGNDPQPTAMDRWDGYQFVDVFNLYGLGQ